MIVTTSKGPGLGPRMARLAKRPAAQISGVMDSTISPAASSRLSIVPPRAANAMAVRDQASLVRSPARPGSASSGSSDGSGAGRGAGGTGDVGPGGRGPGGGSPGGGGAGAMATGSPRP